MDLEFFLQEEALEKKCKDEVLADLQKEAECGKVNLNEVSGAYFREKVNEKMKKMSYLKELERSFGEPQPLSDGRYGWRVNGRKGYFPRGKSIEGARAYINTGFKNFFGVNDIF